MKVFRKFRAGLIGQGNLRDYILYAFGEILLVMVGILLAFQVSNWSEDRVKKDTEINYYQNIRNQIVDDKGLIQSLIDYNNNYMSQFQYANEIIEANDRSKMDTLGLIAINLVQNSDFDRQGNIYETMVNSGEIKILRSHRIVNGIRKLEENYLYINRMENIHYDAMIKYVIPAINPAIKFSTGEIKRPEDVYNYQFQNLILQIMKVMSEKDQTYHTALTRIEEIISQIDNELDTDN